MKAKESVLSSFVISGTRICFGVGSRACNVPAFYLKPLLQQVVTSLLPCPLQLPDQLADST